MTQAIRDWLCACPLIDPDDLFCVEYICPDPLSYSLQEKHGDLILKRYADGTTLRARTWVLTAVQNYGPDLAGQIANSDFWQQLTDWVETQDRHRRYPALPQGCLARSIGVSAPHLAQSGTDAARYQAELIRMAVELQVPVRLLNASQAAEMAGQEDAPEEQPEEKPEESYSLLFLGLAVKGGFSSPEEAREYLEAVLGAGAMELPGLAVTK